MQFSTLLMTAVLATVGQSQTIAGLPTCANPCVTQYTTGSMIAGCSGLDIACICRSSSFISSIACCLQASCNAADQATAIAFAQNICTTAGVTVPSSVDGLCTNAAAVSSSSSTGQASSSTNAAAAATGSSVSSAASSRASSITSATSSTSSVASAASATSSRAATSTAAANNIVGGGNAAIAGGLALLALL